MEKVTIKLPMGVRMPTDEEMREAKSYILQREDAIASLSDVVGDLIDAAAVQLVRIAYSYDIPVSRFRFASSVDERMMEEVDAVMEDLYEELYAYLQESAVSCTENTGRHSQLLALLATLGHRGSGMRDSLYAYEWRMLRQSEALIASMKYAQLPLNKAVSAIRTGIRNFTGSPLLKDALRHPTDFAAPYILNGGRATFPDGSENVHGVPVNGYDAIKLLFGAAVANIWARNRYLEMQERDDVAGFYILRGSNYPCALCDSFVGYHEKGEGEAMPPYHPSCCCYTINIYKKQENES